MQLLATLTTEKYAISPPEFALILRVDGSLGNYGVERAEKPILRKRYIQVDIVVSEQSWALPDAGQREFLVQVIGEAIAAIGQRLAKEKRLLVEPATLMTDYARIAATFLGDRRG